MLALNKGRYRARIAATAADVGAAQRLRALAFQGDPEAPPDRDRFDAFCDHVLVEDGRDGALVGCFRMLPLAAGHEIDRSYSAQFYDLAALRGFAGPMVEVGRFCIHPGRRDADILRVAWAALTRHVDENGVEMLFGCSSFHGTDAERYHDAFALLRARHLAPDRWRPRVKAPGVIRFAQAAGGAPDARRAMLAMPPLLRTYLAMGGWVSDHAVVDRQMNTLHVFTGLEIRMIPAARQRLLRAVAG